jgi:hypothetical protein
MIIILLKNINNLNIFFLDYLYNNFKNKIINILNKKHELLIICFTNYNDNYDYDFLNTKISTNELKIKLDNLNVKYFIKNNNIHDYINITNNIKYDYILYIPNNYYTLYNIDIKLFNDNIILNDDAFILPYKYKDNLKYCLMKEYDKIKEQHIVHNTFMYKHKIKFKISDKFIINTNNIKLLKNNIGLHSIHINNLDNIKNFNISYDTNLINNRYNEINLLNYNKIAIIIIGQIRTFIYPKIYNSLKKQLNNLKEKNIDYHLFVFIENKMKYDYLWQNIDNNHNIDEINKNKIINIINSITSKYTIKFYKKEKEEEKIPVIGSLSHTLQSYLLYTSYNFVKNYEKKENITFKYIIKTRPDLYYKNNISLFLRFNNINKFCILDWDFLYIIPRYISNEIIENIYYMYLNPRMEDLLNPYNMHNIYDNNPNNYIFNKNNKRLDLHLYLLLYICLSKICKYEIINIVEHINPRNIDSIIE